MSDTDPWSGLRRFTPARIALGRAGASLPTSEVLAFGLSHARARDAVHAPFDGAGIAEDLRKTGLAAVVVDSDATERAVYLSRPDYGRRLSPVSRHVLEALGKPGGDIVIVIADGLSARAVESHARHLVSTLRPRIATLGLGLGPVIVVRGGRVAIGDQIAAIVGARAVLMLIGERPGLSSPDSLGAYLTFAPGPGTNDANRNCVSNIRPEGLSIEDAAAKIAWLFGAAFLLGLTGVDLKDESDRLAVGGAAPTLVT